jgi:hypothetical protein
MTDESKSIPSATAVIVPTLAMTAKEMQTFKDTWLAYNKVGWQAHTHSCEDLSVIMCRLIQRLFILNL